MEGGERKERMEEFLHGVMKEKQEEEDEEEEGQNPRIKRKMDVENEKSRGKRKIDLEGNKAEEEKNLLLKYDLLQDRFHFAEDGGKKLMEMKKKEEKKEEKDVEFVNGKLIVRMEKNTEEFGKKRKREN